MFCKKCGSNIDDGSPFCAGCGEPVPELEPEVIPAQEEPAKPEEASVEPEQVKKEKERTPKKQSVLDPETKKAAEDKIMKIAVSVICLLVLAAVLVVVILKSLDSGIFDKKEDTPTETVQTTEEVPETTTAPEEYPNYSVDDATIEANLDKVVATVGDYELTVSQLQLHYWFQVYMYQEKYIDYIRAGYIKLDVTAPLAEQSSAEDPAMSWQQYFLKKALTTWQSYAVMNMLADQDGFYMDEAIMTDLKASTLEDAKGAGFDSAESYVNNMLSNEVGANITVDDYWAYMEFVNRATAYFGEWYEKATPTDAEMEAYYAENEKTFVDGGASKDAGKIVDVRHILIMVAEDTDAGWKAAEAEANRIYQEWKDGGATEELFAELANKYSEDGGSNTNGGLYTGVQAGSMVEVFNDWIMDDARVTGDSAVLKADYHYQGYHVMFFVKSTGIWENAVMQTMLTERSTEMLSGGMEKWPIEKVEENYMIGTPKFG